MAESVALLWSVFIACVWIVCYADMLDCVLIYVDICAFRYIDMDGCKLYEVDIIIHDTKYKIWYVNVSYNIHIVEFLHCICTGTSHWVGCECTIGKLTPHLVGSVNGTTSNRVVKVSRFLELAVRHQKSSNHKKAHRF